MWPKARVSLAWELHQARHMAGVPELSQLEHPELRQLPPYFMRVGSQWRGVTRSPDVPTDYSNRFCRRSAGEVLEHVFLQWKLGPPT
ncbi:MAG TPA: hypothetical protein VF815_01145, partial [Myxococcaceae bacterium]